MELSFFVTLTNLNACEENEMQQGLCYERGFHFHQHVTQLCSCITISCMENNLKVISFIRPDAFPPDFNYLCSKLLISKETIQFSKTLIEYVCELNM